MENFSMIDFNYFDVTIGAIVLILGIKGFMNGFIKEVFGLVGLVVVSILLPVFQEMLELLLIITLSILKTVHF